MTDCFMTLCVVAAFAEGTTTITNIANQRVKVCVTSTLIRTTSNFLNIITVSPGVQSHRSHGERIDQGRRGGT
jgi:hypothetical protein